MWVHSFMRESVLPLRGKTRKEIVRSNCAEPSSTATTAHDIHVAWGVMASVGGAEMPLTDGRSPDGLSHR